MSRIDWFLLSENWCLTWPNCLQMASSRGLSNYCPLQLCIDVANWGPKPVRMLKCWENFTGYDSFVREKWSSFHLEGWGGFPLKEKFKLIKLALKEWHRNHSQNLPARICSLKDQTDALEVKVESAVLLAEEVESLHGFSDDILVFVGNYRECNGYVKGMQTRNSSIA